MGRQPCGTLSTPLQSPSADELQLFRGQLGRGAATLYKKVVLNVLFTQCTHTHTHTHSCIMCHLSPVHLHLCLISLFICISTIVICVFAGLRRCHCRARHAERRLVQRQYPHHAVAQRQPHSKYPLTSPHRATGLVASSTHPTHHTPTDTVTATQSSVCASHFSILMASRSQLSDKL